MTTSPTTKGEIKKFIRKLSSKKYAGERCEDFDADCPGCEHWWMLDLIAELQKENQTLKEDVKRVGKALQWIRPWVEDAYSEKQIENGKALMDVCVLKIETALSQLSPLAKELISPSEDE